MLHSLQSRGGNSKPRARYGASACTDRASLLFVRIRLWSTGSDSKQSRPILSTLLLLSSIYTPTCCSRGRTEHSR